MNYQKEKIVDGVNVHLIENKRFKTNLIACFLTIPLEKEMVTYNSVMTSVLKKGTMNLKSLDEINKKLEEMYGANLDCGIDKIGDNISVKFYIELLNDEYALEKENLLEQGINLLFDIIFNPLIENDSFNEEYVNLTKEKVRQIILSRKDNKSVYSYDRCIEEMFEGQPFAEYKYGNLEQLEKINGHNLYEYYKDFVSNCNINIFVVGDNIQKSKELVENNNLLKSLNSRNVQLKNIDKIKKEKSKEIIEKLDVAQGKLAIGLFVDSKDDKEKDTIMIYNFILGGGANSKMFQNVREKEQLAYSAGSSYSKRKNIIIIRCGIEIDKYEKALEVIKQQLEDMKNGIFTEEDITNAKKTIVASVKSIPEEQDSEIVYYFGQEFVKNKRTIEEYIKDVQNISKEDIISVANKISIDTIYFLRN